MARRLAAERECIPLRRLMPALCGPVHLSTPALSEGLASMGPASSNPFPPHPGGLSALTPAPAMLHRQAAFTATKQQALYACGLMLPSCVCPAGLATPPPTTPRPQSGRPGCSLSAPPRQSAPLLRTSWQVQGQASFFASFTSHVFLCGHCRFCPCLCLASFALGELTGDVHSWLMALHAFFCHTFQKF